MARDAMRDVELVDVDTGAVLGDDSDHRRDPAAAARRRARLGRLLRRWWPVPVVLAGALVATQVVLDARERDRVAALQEVPGVLRTVDRSLEPRATADDLTALLGWGEFVAGDLRITTAGDGQGAERALVARTADGTEAWRTSLEAAPGGDPTSTVDFPACAADAEPATVIRCLVVDRDASATLEEAAGWQVGPPLRGRLVAVDARTGAVLASREVPGLSNLAGADARQVLLSVDDGALHLTSWDTAADPLGPDDPAAPALWRARVPLERTPQHPLSFAPWLALTDVGVLVGGDLGSWAFASDDGELLLAADGELGASRTGYLTVDGTRLVDPDGGELPALPGTPVWYAVDDGSLPGTEIVLGAGPDGVRLIAVEAGTGRELWSVPQERMAASVVVLLADVLYGAGDDAVWARDARDGRELWRTRVGPTADGGLRLHTDGQHLLVTARPEDLGEAGIPVAPGGGDVALAALDLGSGRPAWATRLPEGVHGVGSTPTGDGELIGWGDDGTLVLLN
jgi:outer membrane protein assembly factor BamB